MNIPWITFVIIVGLWGTVPFLTRALGGTWLKLRKGHWEKHPCDPPTFTRGPRQGLAEGLVWQCRCKRRWRYLGRNQNAKDVWKEITPEVELAEAERALKKLEGETDR